MESKIYLIIVNFQTFFFKFFYIVLRPNQKIRGQIDFDVKKKRRVDPHKSGLIIEAITQNIYIMDGPLKGKGQSNNKRDKCAGAYVAISFTNLTLSAHFLFFYFLEDYYHSRL